MTSATMAVTRRAAQEGLRDPGPALLLPALPSLLMAVAFTAQFDRIVGVIDLGTESYDTFVVPGLVMVVALAAGGFTSAQLAGDMRSGFWDRLRLYPAGAKPLLLGRFAYEGLRVLPGAIAVLLLGLAIGGSVDNGIAGVAVILALTMLMSAAFAGLHMIVATFTEDPQTPLNLQPVGVLVFFLSSAIVPPDAMPRWAEVIATYNPVTAIVDGGREALIGELTSDDVLVAFVVAGGWLAIAIAAAIALVTARTTRG